MTPRLDAEGDPGTLSVVGERTLLLITGTGGRGDARLDLRVPSHVERLMRYIELDRDGDIIDPISKMVRRGSSDNSSGYD